MDVARNFTVGVTPLDATAMQYFLSARNMEDAKQYSLAVSSFHAVLRSGSQIIPLQVVSEHLEAIKKDHPQDYEAGLQITANTPEPRVAIHNSYAAGTFPTPVRVPGGFNLRDRMTNFPMRLPPGFPLTNQLPTRAITPQPAAK